MPKLEIETNDVRCTHGATVGPIDEEQVFYLTIPGPAADRRAADDRAGLLRAGGREDPPGRCPRPGPQSG